MVSKLRQFEATAPRAVSKFSIDSVTATRKREPDKILLIGVEGIGKSTWSANAPDPIFISLESGLAELDAKAFSEPENFLEVLDQIDVLINDDHGFRTLAVDTIDALEPLIWRYVCDRDSVDSIEKVGGGYGKGYVAALDQWRVFLDRLDQLWQKRGMEIHLLAHASINTFQNPSGPDYMRYEPAIHKKGAAPLVKQWAKTVLFATYEEWVADAQKGDVIKGVATNKRVKGMATGARIIHTQRTAAWDAKNRHGLPPTLALDYPEYTAAREAGLQVDTEEVVKECIALADKLQPAASAGPRKFIEANKDNPAELVRVLNRLRAMVAEAGA
jgi:hypothetical protein